MSLVNPSHAYMSRTDSLEDKDYKIETDHEGFIEPTGNAANSVKIIFHGGSTTECLYVDEDLRFPALVDKGLQERYGSESIGTWNSGASGNNTMHSINSFLNKSLSLKPQHTILMHNTNDLAVLLNSDKGYHENNSGDTFMSNRTLITTPSKKSIASRFKEVLPFTYTSLRLARSLFPVAENQRQAPQRVTAQDLEILESDKEFAARRERVLKQFKEKLETFIHISRAHDVIPVLMTQASRIDSLDKELHLISPENIDRLKGYGISLDQFQQLYKGMNNEIRKAARSQNVELIDLAERIPSNSIYIYDMVHLNNKGSELASRIITEAIGSLIELRK